MSSDRIEEHASGIERHVAIIGTRGYPSYYGGFETAVRKLAPFLSKKGWSVTVYGRPGATMQNDPSFDSSVRAIQTYGIEKKSLSTLTYGLTATLSAMVQKPDVALVMNVANGFWLPLLKLRGIPAVVNVDGMEWERAKWGPVAKFVFKLGAKMTARFGTALITDAREIQRRWEEDFNRQSTFIPYGGDLVDEFPIENGLNHRGYVLLVARFVPENTVGEFFDATEVLASEVPVILVGATGYGGELDERAKSLADVYPNVHWLGHVKDDKRLFSLFQHAGAYFHGHSVGGTNPALVQAMACGAPIVARDTVYNREVLGETALFAMPDPGEIVRVVREALLDVQGSDERAKRAKDRASSEYSWQSVCEAYDNILVESSTRVELAARQ